MPRPAATDAPPLSAGQWSKPAAVVGLIAGAVVGVTWGVAGGNVVDWVAAAFAGGAVVLLAWLIGDAAADRLRANGGMRTLSDGRPAEWAEEARTDSRRHAERAAAIADGVGDPYLSTQRYVAEYFRRANGWVAETNRRLHGRFTLVALGAVGGVLAAVCGMTPERAKESSFVALGWPAVLAAVAGTAAGVEVLSRGRKWERVFAAWREWATDSETPDLPPPTPAVELVKPPKPKKPPAATPPPPPVVELVAPPPPPPKPVTPPPHPPKPAMPSPLERLKGLDLKPPPDDDNDRK